MPKNTVMILRRKKDSDENFPSNGMIYHDWGNFSDTQIWEAFRCGNESAFIYIYQQYFHALFQYGCQFTHNESLVEDVLQDMFIEIRSKRQNTVIKKSIKNYLFACLRRKIFLYKNKYEDNLVHLDVLDFTEFDIAISPEQRIIEAQITKENQDWLVQAIKQLSQRQREAIYYFYYEGLNYKEIKELMDFTNIRSIRNLIYKALASMKLSMGSIYICCYLLYIP